MRDSTKAKLEAISTATLTTVLFKRGFRNTFIGGIHRINPAGEKNMVGPAYTLRYIPAREDLIPVTVQPDGSPGTYRIPEPRMITLTNTFEF